MDAPHQPGGLPDFPACTVVGLTVTDATAVDNSVLVSTAGGFWPSTPLTTLHVSGPSNRWAEFVARSFRAHRHRPAAVDAVVTPDGTIEAAGAFYSAGWAPLIGSLHREVPQAAPTEFTEVLSGPGRFCAVIASTLDRLTTDRSRIRVRFTGGRLITAGPTTHLTDLSAELCVPRDDEFLAAVTPLLGRFGEVILVGLPGSRTLLVWDRPVTQGGRSLVTTFVA